MVRNRVTAMRLLAVVGLLVATAFAGGVVAAQEGAALSQLTETPQTGALQGDAAGGFAYYQIAYPGNDEALVVRLAFWPNDVMLARSVGLNVYGPDITGEGEPKEGGAYLEYEYSGEDAATLLVQVYNYSSTTVNYEIAAEGIPAQAPASAEAPVATETETPAAPTAAPTAAPAATPEAGEAAAVAAPMSGTVDGNSAGAFALHTVTGSGDGEDVTVTMSFWPYERSYSAAIGFNVYAPDGTRVATGDQTSTFGQDAATFAADVAGDYVVQVYNYVDGLTLSYSLAVES